jgi:hypothetical protein
LDGKESVIAQMKLNKEHQESQIRQLKDHIGYTGDAHRDKEMKDLQRQFEEIKKNMQEYIKLLDSKDQQIAKLNHEVKLVHDREHQRFG